MACELSLHSPPRFLLLSMMQVPMGVLSARDVEALSPIQGSAISKRTT